MNSDFIPKMESLCYKKYVVSGRVQIISRSLVTYAQTFDRDPQAF